MARRRALETRTGDDHDTIVDHYRAELEPPAEFPWGGWEYPPVMLGPSWQTTAEGRWALPAATLGWDVLGWCGCWLQHRGEPWRFTLEQARFVLWWYAVDETGRWLYEDGVLQRLKGWGKDPLAACLCAVEAFGPARVAYMDGDRPVAVDVDDAWVQTAATSLEQTRNTMRLFPSLFTREARSAFQLQIGKELIHGLGDTRLIQAVTSSPATLEGNRGSFIEKNETQHWLSSNNGHGMADVIERNAAKSEGGTARSLAITNGYNPAEDSVAQRDREAFEKMDAGEVVRGRLLYDSLEAAAGIPLNVADLADETVDEHRARQLEHLERAIGSVRGDSIWLDLGRTARSILDPRNTPSRSRRFWLNQIVSPEDAWVDVADWDLGRVELHDTPADQWALFFDGSKSDDSTGLVGCRMDDGLVRVFGHWQKPPGERGAGWLAPRDRIDVRVGEVFADYRVVAFWADPSHTLEDESLERYWDGLIDEWHHRYSAELTLWARAREHSVAWDMASPANTAAFTAAAERAESEIASGKLPHDGDGRLRAHVQNARRRHNRWGISLGKEHRDSQRKVDLAVCMVGARMVRRNIMLGAPRKTRSGRVW